MHEFSKHFTREIEVEICWKTLDHCVFTIFSCFEFLQFFSWNQSWKQHKTTAFSRIFMCFGLLQNVENINLKSGGLWPSPLRWGNPLQCYSPFWGVTMFWKDQLWRTQLPQVSIVVQAMEVLLYLPWTAVYASPLLTVSSVRIFLASPSSFLIIESSSFCQGFFGWWWCGSLGNGLQSGSVVWFRIRDMIRTAQSFQFGCINHSKKVGQFGCWALSRRRRRCWIQRTIITFRPFRHTILKVKFLCKNSILTKLYNFSREIKVANN